MLSGLFYYSFEKHHDQYLKPYTMLRLCKLGEWIMLESKRRTCAKHFFFFTNTSLNSCLQQNFKLDYNASSIQYDNNSLIIMDNAILLSNHLVLLRDDFSKH